MDFLFIRRYSLCENLNGGKRVLKKTELGDFVYGDDSRLVLGRAGTGRSSTMSKGASDWTAKTSKSNGSPARLYAAV